MGKNSYGQNRLCLLAILFVMFQCFGIMGTNARGSDIMPTDIYYLAKSIDDSLISAYGLTSIFEKKMLSSNIRPRNSYQKLLSLADEFNLLHNNAISKAKLDAARQVDTLATKPGDLYNVLSLIKNHLVRKDMFFESAEMRSPKTPSDVTHMLRQISFHHIEIAEMKNIPYDWSTPAQVYDAVMRDILPVVTGVADEAGVEYEPYPFPRQPEKGVIPRNITKIIQHIYGNIAQYYKKKGNYDSLVLIEVSDCDDISPGDSFDLVKAISAELRAMSGDRQPDTKVLDRYKTWKASKEKIGPGDVYRLLQHIYILSKTILEHSAK